MAARLANPPRARIDAKPRLVQPRNGPPLSQFNRLAANPRALRPPHLAHRVIRPVAVEADDAPLDTPTRADHAAVLGDGVMDHVSAAVGDFDDAAAEAAWNGLRGPRAERGLAHLLEIEDAEISGPV